MSKIIQFWFAAVLFIVCGGSAKDVTDAGYITAYYYQTLQAQKLEGKLDSFTVFKTAQKNKEKEIEEITKKNQKKKQLK